MENNIEQLKAERLTIINTPDKDFDAKMSKRLREINFLLNTENKYNKVYYRGFGEYTECSPVFVGDKFRKQIENGERINAFFKSHHHIDDQSITNLSPVTTYDCNSMEHRQMMHEKRVVRLLINPSKVTYGCERIDISANLSFSYYIDENLREINLDIYVRDGYRWESNGINWSAMGTTDTNIALIYAEMIKIGVTIHDSLFCTAMSIKHTKPAPLDNSPQS